MVTGPHTEDWHHFGSQNIFLACSVTPISQHKHTDQHTRVGPPSLHQANQASEGQSLEWLWHGSILDFPSSFFPREHLSSSSEVH